MTPSTHWAILNFALLSIWRFRAKLIPLWLVYVCMVGFFSSVVLLTSSLTRESKMLLSEKSPDVWLQKIAGGRVVPLDQSFADTLLRIRGVGRVVPRIWGYVFDSPTGSLISVMGLDSLAQLPYLSSGFKEKIAKRQVICGQGIMKIRELQDGDALTIEDSEGKLCSYKIVGSFTAESNLLTLNQIVVNNDDARQLLGYNPNQVTDFALYIPNKLEATNIERKIARSFGGFRLINRSQLMATYDSVFGRRGSLFTVGVLVSLLTFLVILWDKSASFASGEQKESALFKAVGWSGTQILTLRMMEAVIISLSATCVALLLAYLHVFVFDAYGIKAIVSGWASLLPNYHLDPRLSFEDLMVVFVFGVLPYLAASLIPAWLSSVMSAEQAMQ